MEDAAKIPVIVTGAEVAQGQLRATQAALENLRRAGVSGAPGRSPAAEIQETAVAGGQAAGGIEQLDEKTQQFTRHGRMLAADVLRLINPELGAMAQFAFHAAMGIAELTPALLATAGGAAALGAVVLWIKSADDAAKKLEAQLRRVQEAQADLRKEALPIREKAGEELLAAGIAPEEKLLDQIMSKIVSGAERGEAPGTTIAAEIARMRMGLGPEQVEQLKAGWAMRGGKPPTLSGADWPKQQAALEAAMAAGAGPEGGPFLEAQRAVQREGLMREAPVEKATQIELQTRIDTALERLKKERPGRYTDEDLKLISRMAREPGLAGEGSEDWQEQELTWGQRIWASLFLPSKAFAMGPSKDWRSKEMLKLVPDRASRTMGELMSAAEDVGMVAGARQEAEAPPPIGPVIINNWTSNANNVYRSADNPFGNPAPGSDPDLAGIGN